MKKLILLFGALVFASLGSLEAVQVIEQSGSTSSRLEKGFGEGLKRGIEQGIAEASEEEE